MSLRLTYLGAADSLPVEVEGLTPDATASMTLAEIERFPIRHGNQETRLADLFRVAGDPTDLRIDIDGNLASVHYIGAGMAAGAIDVHSAAGRHVGSAMHSGRIHVRGDAGDWLGAEMRGGLIRVDGRVGNLVGAAHRGAPKGMTGGAIIVHGDAGHEIGRAMRRGMIAIGGSTGELAGYDMLAGSIVALGSLGPRAGAGMRRGTIASLAAAAPTLLPSFHYACTGRPPILRLMLRALGEHGLSIDASLGSGEFDLYNGDLLALGRGEIFVRHQ